ncbi:MAG: Fe-only nitrogenase accessory AnfO family protein [Syntrophomonadaceae bacterium]|nr:Fe-only nitrogenase accessory AnfO family protein [Syntrophomonadaceae bacterium]
MEIAVLIAENGDIAPLQEATYIQVYRNICNIWEPDRSMPLTIPWTQGLPAMRKYMQIIVEFLGECRTLTGLSVIGLPYFELEKAGCTIWELPGSPYDALGRILEAETAAAELPPLNIAMPSILPQEISPGCYSISIKAIQNCNHKITSKQILLPLLKDMNFCSLEVTCSHLPPWLEQQIITGQLNARIIPVGPLETKIVINGEQATP